jgi:hypothetical protein
MTPPVAPARRREHLAVVVGGEFHVAAVLEVLGPSVERQKSAEQPLVDRERDQRLAESVWAGKVAVLEQVVENCSSPAAGVER